MKPTQREINELRNDYSRIFLSGNIEDGKWDWCVKDYLRNFEMITGQPAADLEDCCWWMDNWEGLNN